MKPLTVLAGDCRETLRTLPDASVQCCVTSPPYFQLRDYQHAGQLGMERTWPEYVGALVAVFREVRRVLKPDGLLWLVLGDSYVAAPQGAIGSSGLQGSTSAMEQTRKASGPRIGRRSDFLKERAERRDLPHKQAEGLPAKNLLGIPWRVAFALQADGWLLRQQIPWVKRNGMPESARDRPVTACETVFLLSKSRRSWYDYEAVRLPASLAFQNDGRWRTGSTGANVKTGYEANGAQNPKKPHRMFDKERGHPRPHAGTLDAATRAEQCGGWRATRNSDWFFEGLLNDACGGPLAFVVGSANFKGSHFATFPPALVQPCILAGSRPGDVILDPFAGSGTTAMVALELGRRAIACELNPAYLPLIESRCRTTPGLAL